MHILLLDSKYSLFLFLILCTPKPPLLCVFFFFCLLTFLRLKQVVTLPMYANAAYLVMIEGFSSDNGEYRLEIHQTDECGGYDDDGEYAYSDYFGGGSYDYGYGGGDDSFSYGTGECVSDCEKECLSDPSCVSDCDEWIIDFVCDICYHNEDIWSSFSYNYNGTDAREWEHTCDGHEHGSRRRLLAKTSPKSFAGPFPKHKSKADDVSTHYHYHYGGYEYYPNCSAIVDVGCPQTPSPTTPTTFPTTFPAFFPTLVLYGGWCYSGRSTYYPDFLRI